MYLCKSIKDLCIENVKEIEGDVFASMYWIFCSFVSFFTLNVDDIFNDILLIEITATIQSIYKHEHIGLPTP